MGKLKEGVEYLSRYATETLSAEVSATSYLLFCLVDYIIGERKLDTFNIQ